MSNTMQRRYLDDAIESGAVPVFPLPSSFVAALDDSDRASESCFTGVEVRPLDRGLPYLVCFPTVRDGLLRILAAPQETLDARLVALMDVCQRLSTYFDENSTGVDERRLLDDLDGAFASSFRPSAFWADTMAERVAHFYLWECTADGPPHFVELLQRVRRRYGADGAPEQRWNSGAVLRAYRRRRARVLLCHGSRFDRSVTDYCLNRVLVEPYVDWPDLRAYAIDLALRIASFRFFLFSHPAVWCAYHEAPSASDDEANDGWVGRSFDKTAAETFRSLERAWETPGLLTRLRESTGIGHVPGAAGLCGLVTS